MVRSKRNVNGEIPEPGTIRFLEDMRGHITEQLTRISAENDTRARLLQEEIDRRFETLRDLVDERRDNSRQALQMLHEELDRRLTNMGLLGSQRHADLKEMMLTGQETARASVQAAMTASNQATSKAETANDKRFDGVNEFRKALQDQTASYIPRAEFDAQIKGLTERMNLNTERAAALELRLSSRLDTTTGERSGTVSSLAEQRAETSLRANLISVLITAVATAVAVISFIMYAMKK